MLSNLSPADRDYIGHDLPAEMARDLFRNGTDRRWPRSAKARLSNIRAWCTVAAMLAYLAASGGALVRIANIGATFFS